MHQIPYFLFYRIYSNYIHIWTDISQLRPGGSEIRQSETNIEPIYAADINTIPISSISGHTNHSHTNCCHTKYSHTTLAVTPQTGWKGLYLPDEYKA